MRSKKKKAVGLQYKHRVDNAPKVVVKGEGITAEKIIQAAKRLGIPVEEDPDLVEVLSCLDLQEEIPPALYVIVAEFLAFIYKMNGKKI